MDFGKLASVDSVAFTLPPEDGRSAFVLREAPARAAGRLRLGTPAWAHREWVGEVYPAGTKPRDYLTHYARRFSCIELNSTHYAVPKPEILERWVQDTPPGFRFDAKVLQGISHRGRLGSGSADLGRFCAAMRRLGDRLGLVWLQLPPSAGPRQLGDLEGLLDGLPAGIEGAVELRHPEWFEDRRLIPAAFDVLAERDVALVITDVAGRRDLCHASLPAPRTMIRFVGNQLHPSDYRRADAWLPRLKGWLDAGAESLDLIVHQPGDLLSPKLAAYIEEGLQSRLGLRVRPEADKPADLAAPQGQLTLF